MKLNGWMRLWVVLSVFWLAIAGFVTYDEVSLIYKKRTYEVGKKNVGNVDFVFSAAQSDKDIKELINNELIPMVEKAPTEYLHKVITTHYEKYLEENASAAIWKCILIALVPVFGSLAIGWSFIWVRRGFKGGVNA